MVVQTQRNVRRPRLGFTLIEIVAGLVLMAGLMSAALVALASHQRGLALSQRRLAAVPIADRLLSELASRRDGFPIAASGTIADPSGRQLWRWETRVVAVAELFQIPVRIVRFDLRSGQGDLLVRVDTVHAMNAELSNAEKSNAESLNVGRSNFDPATIARAVDGVRLR